MSEKKRWLSEVPERCQVCNEPIDNVFIDGWAGGPWALMCPSCHKMYGVGVGTGRAQEYTFNPESGNWEKTNG